MSQFPLSQAVSGDRCLVLDIAPEPSEIRSRLYALGMVPGSALEVLRFAPLGDPIQVRVSGSLLSIRRSEAESITVERQSGESK